MIFAAGLGTRLGTLTRDMPKALIPVGGVPMLGRVARRLVHAGADHLIINTHRFTDQIRDYVREAGSFGVEVTISEEQDHPLETGGGLRQAAPLFRRDAPFYLHNSDILTDLPLRPFYESHIESGALASLAVMRRPTSRYLLFDEEGLFGRVDQGKDLRLEVRRPRGTVAELAFGGVHVVSPEIFPLLTEEGVFSILEPYLRLASEGHRIVPFRMDDARWIDIGKPDELERANQFSG